MSFGYARASSDRRKRLRNRPAMVALRAGDRTWSRYVRREGVSWRMLWNTPRGPIYFEVRCTHADLRSPNRKAAADALRRARAAMRRDLSPTQRAA